VLQVLGDDVNRFENDVNGLVRGEDNGGFAVTDQG